MKGSFRIATVAGIGVFVHWTFFILLLWIAYSHAADGENAAMVLEGVVFVVALFVCVLLHEFGHALTARRFGVTTRDITLLPIGGVARLERIPENPWQEFLVAIAGPAVNLVIAAVLVVPVFLLGTMSHAGNLTVVGGDFLSKLMWVNLGLIVFNMLPAFPMDGGRVLRALLATRMSRVKATHYAATVGQLMAIVFGALGVFSGQWMLLLIAFVVFQGAQSESAAVELRAMFHGVRVRDVMITQFQTLNETDSVDVAVIAASRGLQKDFPVTNRREITGILLQQDILNALAAGKSVGPVADVMRRDCITVSEREPLNQALARMQDCGSSTLLVVRDDDVVGLLSEEHLGQWVRMHTSLRDRQPNA